MVTDPPNMGDLNKEAFLTTTTTTMMMMMMMMIITYFQKVT
jgi:hypothetical protein